jgi:hypothetical protein
MVELFVPLFAMLDVWRLGEIGGALGDAFPKKGDAAVNELGRAFGASLIAPLYGVLFGVVCRIMKARVER